MSKPLFNSLGSNYSLRFAMAAFRHCLWPTKSAASLKRLEKVLSEKYDGSAFLFYKGRDAIEFALRAYSIGQGDQVLTQAFTCHAIEEAILRAGARPVFVDLEKDALNPNVETLSAAFNSANRPKAVLIQHTLGYVADIQKIKKWCQEKNILLIEDVAQSFGARDAENIEVGKYGDVVICSFGRDKVIDAVSGGAAVLKNSTAVVTAQQIKLGNVPEHIVRKDMLYPLLTWIIRHSHQIVVGKILFKVARSLQLITSPITTPIDHLTRLPAAYAELVLLQLEQLTDQLHHRQQIADVYARELENIGDKIKKGSSIFLRYAVRMNNPDALARNLLHKNIFITDRWYRSAVDSGSLHLPTVYQEGSCPHAELLAKHIINLPTHFGISEMDAVRIAREVKKYSERETYV